MCLVGVGEFGACNLTPILCCVKEVKTVGLRVLSGQPLTCMLMLWIAVRLAAPLTCFCQFFVLLVSRHVLISRLLPIFLVVG
ncbi:hypothetical protein QQP08_022823 [Theobroma cacao]|nr:hypothetical protein QQP08_022823 [Theobroma cacao]